MYDWVDNHSINKINYNVILSFFLENTSKMWENHITNTFYHSDPEDGNKLSRKLWRTGINKLRTGHFYRVIDVNVNTLIMFNSIAHIF